MSQAESRIEGLDLIRALAITMVIVHHVGRGLLKGFIPNLFGEAWTGVDLFFLISGFLVTRSFSRWLSNIGTSTHFSARAVLASRYCLRRLARIIPPAWIWAALPLLGATYFNQSGAFGIPSEIFREFIAVVKFQYNYFTVATGMSHINHFWSLAIEEHYYIFLPIFLLLISGRAMRLIGLLFIAVTCEGLRVVARRAGYNFGELLFLTHFRADSLAIGSIVGLLSKKILAGFSALYTRGSLRFVLQLMAVISIGFLWTAPAILSRSQVAYFGFSTFALVSAFLVVFGTSGKCLLLAPRFVSHTVAAIGRRSYSLYLIHVPLINLFNEIRFRTLGMTVNMAWSSWSSATIELCFFLIALMGITELNYRLIERPLIMLVGSRLREKV